jgi:hypothetical protein
MSESDTGESETGRKPTDVLHDLSVSQKPQRHGLCSLFSSLLSADPERRVEV